MMLCSIREEIPKNQQKRPVALMIPVNLRNYFPSQSMTNFFGWIEVGYIFSDETTFEDVLLSVKKQFEEELVKEKIAMHMSGYVRIEKNPFVRAVPLEIKKYFLMIGANLGSRSITAVYSNIGIIRLPEEYKEYIQHFGILQVPILCRCVPVLMGMRWYWDLLPRYRMTVSRGISSGCLERRMFPTEN